MSGIGILRTDPRATILSGGGGGGIPQARSPRYDQDPPLRLGALRLRRNTLRHRRFHLSEGKETHPRCQQAGHEVQAGGRRLQVGGPVPE